MRRSLIVSAPVLVLGALCACRAHRTDAAPATGVELRTDSAKYTVRLDRSVYRVEVGYAFTNRTGKTLSMNVCHLPSPPVLEKEIAAGRWVGAYTRVELMCLTDPPFRVASGTTHRGIVGAAGPPRGAKRFDGWTVDSIPGTYRLTWTLHASADPNDKAGTITAVSPSFQLKDP